MNYSVVADPKLPIAEAVRNANNETILMSFPVAAWGPNNGSAVIEVARLFTTDVFEFERTAEAECDNDGRDAVVHRTHLTLSNEYRGRGDANLHADRHAGRAAGGRPPNPFAAAGMNPGSATVVLHHSMVKLPENPMMPRLFDERVGYFSVAKMDYGRPEHRSQERRYITRWRLEKKDPNAELSEPVKPIVYYIDRATPAWLVPYTKRGVEKWQKAFEAAGFKNAIIAKMQPSASEDPEFHPEDARYSVIRWLPSTIENASGPHVNDPRTGEILESDIQMYHNIMNLQRSWYFLQVGPLDPRVHKLPMPDDLMGNACRIRGGSRGRTHARLPAQHEGQLDVPAGKGPRPRVGQEDGPHADADGLFAIQLCRPARGQDRRRRPGSGHRAVRYLGDCVGLQADPDGRNA